jgi:hypothetical protein
MSEEKRKAYKAAWYLANKERLNAAAAKRYAEKREEVLLKVAQYKEANAEKILAYQREYHAKNRVARLAQQREYRAANPDKYREWADKNREVLLAKKAARKKANPAQNAAHAAAYHAAKLRRIVPFTDLAEVAKVYADAAVMREQGADVAVDHVIPLRGRLVSGLHVHWNLQVIPAVENMRKYNKVVL